jgi:hypothetical protein
MRKMLFAATLAAGFPLNAVADDMQHETFSLESDGRDALLAEARGLTVRSSGSVGPVGGFVPPVITAHLDGPGTDGPRAQGMDWESFEKSRALFGVEFEPIPDADRQDSPDTHLTFKNPDQDVDLSEPKRSEPREILLGTVGTPTKDRTIADFKLAGPNAVEVTFSFFF